MINNVINVGGHEKFMETSKKASYYVIESSSFPKSLSK
jgi:hypothetical protein